MKFNSIISTLALGTVFLFSCQKETDYDLPEPPVPGERLEFSIEEEDPETVETKSILTDASIETKRTGVTVGVYENGALVDKTYSTSFSGITFTLQSDKTYKLYALVNMGDVQSQLPASEASLASFVYTIPAYTGAGQSVNALGIPMAGSLEYQPGVTSVTAIPVKRLLAKVTAVLSCDWTGAKIKSAKIYNMNKQLRPFGTSAASGASDMLSFQEVQMASGAGTNSLTGTFYVPENMQGTVSGITASSNKAGDKNATVGANAAKLTYLEVAIESEGKYDGTVSYRSYLGNNSTTNFDIQRNYRYVWTIHYKSDTVDDFNDDWKHDYDGLEIVDYSLSLSPNPQTIATGTNFAYTTTLSKNIIKPTPSSSSSTLGNSEATWSSSNTSVATVSSAGVVTGVGAGTANITAKYTPAGSDLSERTATASVTVQAIAYELELSATSATTGLKHNETATLKAMYYKLTDGVRDSGTDVTSSAVWSHTGGSKYGVAAGVVSANATSSAPSVQGTTNVTATYNGLGSMNSVDVAFVDITTGTTSISPASASGTYLTPAKFTATYVGTVNGFTTENIDVTNAATWNITGSSIYSVSNGSVTADASTGTHSVAGSATVTATYGGSTSGSATATFTNIVENNLSVSPASGAIQAGGSSVNLTARYITNTNGYETSNTNVTSSATWSSNNSNVTVSAGVVTANLSATGTAVITATYSGKTTTCTLTVSDAVITHYLVVTPATASANVGETISLSASYHTVTNSVDDGGVNVTTSATWSKTSGGAGITVNNSGSSKGKVTASAGGTATIQASYGGETGTATVTFTDVITYDLEVTSATSSANVGEIIAMSAKFYKLTNGSRDAGTDVTTNSSTTWSPTTGTIRVSNSGSTKGQVTATAGGSASIAASYAHSSGTYSDSKTVTFNNVDVEKYRLVITPANAEINWSATQSYTVNRYTDIYRNGSLLTSGSVATPMNSSDFNWSSSSTGVATVSSGVATGVNGGTTTITATLKSSVSDYAKYDNKSVTSSLKVNNVVTYSVEITSSPASGSANVGETITLTVKLFTTTNGVKDAGTDVTSSASWTRASGSANITVGNSGSNKGKVTATGAGTAVVKAEYTYGGNTYSATKSVSFGDVVVEKYRIVVSPSSATIAWNADKQLKVVRYTDTYRNGTLETSGTTGTDMAASNFNWTSSASAKASVNASGLVHGEGTGSATITATLKSGVSEYAKYGNTAPTATITVTEVKTYRLVLSADATSKPYNGTINLTAKYYTTTNGVEDSGVNVTPSALNKVSGGSNITLTVGNPSKAKLTNSALSVVANNKATVTATYAGVTSNSVAIEFTNVSSYRYSRLVVTGDSNVSVGSQTGNYTATLYTQAVVNGVDSGAATASDVSASVTFASTNTSVATMTGRKANGVSAGTTYIRTSYTGTYGTVEADGPDAAMLTVGNVEEDRYRIVMTPATATINWNETQTYVISRYTDHYVNGVKTVTGTTAYTMSNSDFNWTSSSTATATVGSTGIATGVYAGTTTIKAILKSSVSGYSKYTNTTLTSSLTVQNVTEYSLVLTKTDGSDIPSGLQLAVGYTRSLRAWYRTYVNGVQTDQTEVTPSATWTTSPSTRATVTGGEVTGVSNGVVTITASSTPSGKPNRTASASIEIVGGGSEGWDDDWDDGGEVILD